METIGTRYTRPETRWTPGVAAAMSRSEFDYEYNTHIVVDAPQRRVVCAAIRVSNGAVICSARHFDARMHEQIHRDEIAEISWRRAEQGFIDQFGAFMDRLTAFRVAKAAGQIIRKCGNPNGDILYSEHLY